MKMGLESAFEDWRLRAFKITNEKWVGLNCSGY